MRFLELEKVLRADGYLPDEKGQWYRINKKGEREEPFFIQESFRKILKVSSFLVKRYCTKKTIARRPFGNETAIVYSINDMLNHLQQKRRELVSDYPHLLQEYSAQNKIPADKSFARSRTPRIWQCQKCNHTWTANTVNRVNGSGCPSCAGKIVTASNNLAFNYPELVQEYSIENILPADKIFCRTTEKVSWICSKCSHHWITAVRYRTVNNTGCPKCAARKKIKHLDGKRNWPRANVLKNLAVTHPELAKEYMPPPKNLLPADQIVAGTAKKLWWKCQKCDHEWQAAGSSRARGSGCPVCANRVVTEKNNLLVTHPELAQEYMPPPKNKLPSDKVVAGTNQKLWWKCKKAGHEWQAVGSSRVAGKGCRQCATDKRRKP